MTELTDNTQDEETVLDIVAGMVSNFVYKGLK